MIYAILITLLSIYLIPATAMWLILSFMKFRGMNAVGSYKDIAKTSFAWPIMAYLKLKHGY